MEPKIVQAAIIHSDRNKRRYLATVMAEFENGQIVDVLNYYDDELAFRESEFIGLTLTGVSDLFARKDIAYLQS